MDRFPENARSQIGRECRISPGIESIGKSKIGKIRKECEQEKRGRRDQCAEVMRYSSWLTFWCRKYWSKCRGIRSNRREMGHGSNWDGDIGRTFDEDMVRMGSGDMVRPHWPFFPLRTWFDQTCCNATIHITVKKNYMQKGLLVHSAYAWLPVPS